MWMNWCMVGICGGCIPLLLLFRERYTRLELDAVNRQARGSRKQINADHESTPLILSQERRKNGDDVSLPNGTHFSNTEV